MVTNYNLKMYIQALDINYSTIRAFTVLRFVADTIVTVTYR